MVKAGKAGVAIVLGLLLSLTLLSSGVFAQDTTTTQNSANTATRAAVLTGNVQQNTQQELLASNAQPLNAGYACGRFSRCNNYARNGRYGHGYARYGHASRVRCRWVRRGWGRWRRTVRVCRRW